MPPKVAPAPAASSSSSSSAAALSSSVALSASAHTVDNTMPIMAIVKLSGTGADVSQRLDLATARYEALEERIELLENMDEVQLQADDKALQKELRRHQKELERIDTFVLRWSSEADAAGKDSKEDAASVASSVASEMVHAIGNLNLRGNNALPADLRPFKGRMFTSDKSFLNVWAQFDQMVRSIYKNDEDQLKTNGLGLLCLCMQMDAQRELRGYCPGRPWSNVVHFVQQRWVKPLKGDDWEALLQHIHGKLPFAAADMDTIIQQYYVERDRIIEDGHLACEVTMLVQSLGEPLQAVVKRELIPIRSRKHDEAIARASDEVRNRIQNLHLLDPTNWFKVTPLDDKQWAELMDCYDNAKCKPTLEDVFGIIRSVLRSAGPDASKLYLPAPGKERDAIEEAKRNLKAKYAILEAPMPSTKDDEDYAQSYSAPKPTKNATRSPTTPSCLYHPYSKSHWTSDCSEHRRQSETGRISGPQPSNSASSASATTRTSYQHRGNNMHARSRDPSPAAADPRRSARVAENNTRGAARSSTPAPSTNSGRSKNGRPHPRK